MTSPDPTSRLGADPAEAARVEAHQLVRNLCASVAASGYAPDPGLLLGAARVRPTASDADLANIPETGPVLVAAGAAYGTLDALAASFLLDEIRPDVKVVADRFLAGAPNLRRRFVASDPWDLRRAAPANLRALRHELAWLRSGGLLAAFVEQDAWGTAVRLARLAGAAIVPASVTRHETHLPENGTIELRLGAPVTPDRLGQFALDADAAAYLCWRSRELAARHRPALRLVPRPSSFDRVTQST
jgi:hypothetical protein